MTREEWLNKALLLLKRSLFKDVKVPDNIKVSCGLPSKRAFAAKKRVVGQCWPPDSTSDKSIQIFISPTLSEPFKVIDTLAHEMIHAIVGNDQGHKGAFKQMALKVGFTGKMTETIPGAALSDRFKLLVGQLGDYPSFHYNMGILSLSFFSLLYNL